MIWSDGVEYEITRSSRLVVVVENIVDVKEGYE